MKNEGMFTRTLRAKGGTLGKHFGPKIGENIFLFFHWVGGLYHFWPRVGKL